MMEKIAVSNLRNVFNYAKIRGYLLRAQLLLKRKSMLELAGNNYLFM